MKLAARIGTLATLFVLATSVSACTAVEEDVGTEDGAIIELPALDVSPTVRAFESDATAKAGLENILAVEKHNAEGRAAYEAEVAALQWKVTEARTKLEAEKRAWKAAGHKRRCWIFFRCTDWRGATEVEAAKAALSAAKSELYSKPSYMPREAEPMATLIDRTARQHDTQGYGKVAPIDAALARLDAPLTTHAERINQVKALGKVATQMVLTRQEHLDKSADENELITEAELMTETQAVATKLDELNLAVRDLAFTFFTLQSALQNDPYYKATYLPPVPAGIEPSLTNFPLDLGDHDAQSANTLALVAELGRLDGSLEAHLATVNATRTDMAASKREAVAWVSKYLSQTESAIRSPQN